MQKKHVCKLQQATLLFSHSPPSMQIEQNQPFMTRSCFEEDGSPPTHLPLLLEAHDLALDPSLSLLAFRAPLLFPNVWQIMLLPSISSPILLGLGIFWIFLWPVLLLPALLPSFFQTCFQLSLSQSSFFQSFFQSCFASSFFQVFQ